MTDTLQSKFHTFEDNLNAVLVERHEEIHTATLALITGKHHFTLGEPGIGKSMLVDKIIEQINGLDDTNMFAHLLTKFTTPEEVFGPPSLEGMRNDIYRRVTTGKLPEAKIAWLDEIFKANSAILNALLKAINERIFENDGIMEIPLLTLFSASNELPSGSELEAFADRLHFWHKVEPIKDTSNFVSMLQASNIDLEPAISLDDIEEAKAQIQDIDVGEDVFEVMVTIRKELAEEGIKVSDRRFKQALDVIKGEAWLNEEGVAHAIHCRPLIHMLWRDPQQIHLVRQTVLASVDPLEQEIIELREEVEHVYEDFLETLTDEDSNNKKAGHALESLQKYNKAKAEWRDLAKRLEASGRESKMLGELKDRLLVVGNDILERGLDVDGDEDSDSIEKG